MKFQYIHLFCTYIIVTQGAVYVQGSTPLCLLCPCNSKPNIPPNIICDQPNVDNIYNTSFWFDSSNISYPVSSLIVKFHNLTALNTPFPKSNLTFLDLSYNSVSEIGKGVFGELQKMEVLILGNNEIHRINPDVFRGVYTKGEYYPLQSLKTLDLNHNKIHTLDADVFEHIDELETLRLNNNPFQVIDVQTLSAVSSLVNLKVLDLSYTQIKTLPDHLMHTSKYLIELNISGNNLESVPKTLEESHALETLYLNKNPIRNLSGLNIFPKITTLKTLYISEMPVLEEVGKHALCGLQSLEVLHLSYNKELKYIHPDSFLRLDRSIIWPPLRKVNIEFKVYIRYNNISHLDKRFVLQLENLEDLDLRGNPWTCDCLNQGLVDEVIPVYKHLNEDQSRQLECENPIEMKGITLYELNQERRFMKCFNDHDSNPERRGLLLIGIVSGILTGVVLLMLMVYVYRVKILNQGLYNWPNLGQTQYSRV